MTIFFLNRFIHPSILQAEVHEMKSCFIDTDL